MTPLSPEEEHHSRTVAQVIRGKIEAAGGFLPFDRFMELALYAPGLGYYSSGSAKLGAGGDFITAPEISDLFSRCVARQCAEILGETAGSVFELGAGTGRMAAVILQSLAELSRLPERYLILEVSADLRERQQRRIENLPRELRERVVWLDRLPEEAIQGVILANEVLDALPCERFMLREGQTYALGVGVDASGLLIEKQKPADEQLQAAVAYIKSSLATALPEGYRSEVCVRVAPWVAGIADTLKRGAILLFDYGLPRNEYYHPRRGAGTLRCHFKHRAHEDSLLNVGIQDITAWVDFTRVAEAADAAGLSVAGFATQMAFLLGTGIEQQIAQAQDTPTRARLAGEARRLMMPGEMGEIFKAMALIRDIKPALSGFALQDLRRLL